MATAAACAATTTTTTTTVAATTAAAAPPCWLGVLVGVGVLVLGTPRLNATHVKHTTDGMAMPFVGIADPICHRYEMQVPVMAVQQQQITTTHNVMA